MRKDVQNTNNITSFYGSIHIYECLSLSYWMDHSQPFALLDKWSFRSDQIRQFNIHEVPLSSKRKNEKYRTKI